MDIEYLFNIDENAAFSKLTVHIGDKTLHGIIKEKVKALNDFNSGIEQGKTMVYTEVAEDLPNFIKVKLGNLLPNDTLKIELTYI